MTAKSSSSPPLRYTWLALILTYLVSAASIVYVASLLLRDRPSPDLFRPPQRHCKTLNSPCPQYVWDEGEFDLVVKIMAVIGLALTGLSCPLLVSRAIGASLNCWSQSGSVGSKVWAACFYLPYVLGKLLTILSVSLFLSFDHMTPRSVTTPLELAMGGLLAAVLCVETFMSGLIFRYLFTSAEAPTGYELMTDSSVPKSKTIKTASTV
jgi:hypothetical protein